MLYSSLLIHYIYIYIYIYIYTYMYVHITIYDIQNYYMLSAGPQVTEKFDR